MPEPERGSAKSQILIPGDAAVEPIASFQNLADRGD
jgi:hypothetical protein